MKSNQRTVAFQVPEELFERFKEYLKRNGIKQNAFFLRCIQEALDAGQQNGQNGGNGGGEADTAQE